MWGYRRHRDDNDGPIGCVIMLMIAVFLMPIVGIYMIVKGDDTQKGIGVVLTVVGIIIWIYLGLQ